MQTAAVSQIEGEASLFQGLADISRLLILHALADGPRNVSEIVEATGLTQSNVSNHLSCMLGCGLVERRREGRFVYYSHAAGDVTTLLELADRIALGRGTGRSCPHCGSTR